MKLCSKYQVVVYSVNVRDQFVAVFEIEDEDVIPKVKMVIPNLLMK